MTVFPSSAAQVLKLIKFGTRLPLATQNYPSRGQTAVQELYQTQVGKLFLKKVSDRNHRECQIPVQSGTLAEREFWAYRLAHHLGVQVPPLALLDDMTTVQLWLDLPDGKQYKTSRGVLALQSENVFDCALLDWVSGQVDRHDANYLYDMASNAIIPVDSGHAFLKYDGSIPDYLHLFEAVHASDLTRRHDTAVAQSIGKLTPELLKKLVPVRDGIEQEALLRRLEQARHIQTMYDIIQLYRS